MTTPSAPNHPAPSRSRGPSWAVLAIACAAQFMVVLDISIVNVALPSMRTSLGLSPIELQWVVNAYTLTFAGFLLLGGRLADLFGRKKVFLGGLALFTFASLLGGLAQNGTELIFARGLQGLGGAVLGPVTLTLLTTTYLEPKARSRALGAWAGTAASGGAFGAVVGGVLTTEISWRWVLFVNVPIGLMLGGAAAYALVESRGALRGIANLDLPGAVLVTSGLTAVVYAIVSTDAHAWGSAHTIGWFGLGVGLLAAFIAVEARTTNPLVPLSVFRIRALSAANVVAMSLGATLFAFFFFGTLYLQIVLGFSALKAGCSFLPSSFAIIVGTVISTRLVRRVGPRILLIVGPLISCVGLFWFSHLDPTGSFVSNVLLQGIVVAFGIGLSFVPVTLAGTSGVEPKDAGLASGLLNASRQIGAALGLAALSTFAAARTTHLITVDHQSPLNALTTGYSHALMLAALFPLAGAIAATFIPARPKKVPAVPESAAGAPAGG